MTAPTAPGAATPRRDLKPGDRVRLRGRGHVGTTGTIERKQGTAWSVRLDTGAKLLNVMPWHLERIEVSS